MSIQAVSWAIKSQVGDPTLKVLLIAICNYANQDCECWYSQAVLARDSEVSTRTIRRGLEKLREMGLIETTERRRADGGNSTLLIRVLMNEPADKMTGGPSDTSRPVPADSQVSVPSGHTVSAPNEPSFELSLEPLAERKDVALRASSVSSDDWPADAWEQFWAVFPNKVGKPVAFKCFEKARRRCHDWDGIFWPGVLRYVNKTDDRAWLNPATFLNQDRWNEQPAAAPGRSAPAGGGHASFFSEAMGGRNGGR